MIVVAHRGNSAAAPENTLAAITSAVACGAGAVEIDVQLTRDGVPVVIHDEALDRTTTGSGTVSRALAAEVAALDAGSWFGERFAGEGVPLLTDALDLLAVAGGVDLLLEIKGAWGAGDVRRVTDAVADRGLEQRVLVQSFSVATVAALATAAPELRRGLIVMDVGDGVLDLCGELGASACNPHGLALRARPELVAEAHAAGIAVMPWTLNEPEHWAAALSLGVDGVITDRPAELATWAAAQGARTTAGAAPREVAHASQVPRRPAPVPVA